LRDDLSTLIPALDGYTAQGNRQQAHALLHAFKGTTATLGLTALAAELTRLVKICLEDDGLRAIRGQTAALGSLIEATQAAIDDALGAMGDGAPAAVAATPASAEIDREALGRLMTLLEANDMAALGVLEGLRAPLQALSSEHFKALESATQSLDFDAALEACRKCMALDDERRNTQPSAPTQV
jgi:HPt (histidine-containing phosphotransfer) domain-containing protein